MVEPSLAERGSQDRFLDGVDYIFTLTLRKNMGDRRVFRYSIYRQFIKTAVQPVVCSKSSMRGNSSVTDLRDRKPILL